MYTPTYTWKVYVDLVRADIATVCVDLVRVNTRINWSISPPYVARARQMTLSRGGLIAKGFTM
jgi:hypothetical protein